MEGQHLFYTEDILSLTDDQMLLRYYGVVNRRL